MTDHNRRATLAAGLAALALTFAAPRAEAQGFISPLAGYNFSGDSGCPNITGCHDKKLNVGVALGSMGALFGAEEEFAYAQNFFGNASGLSSSVLTLMSNVIVGPAIGPVRPYGVAGLGLIKSHVDFAPGSVLTTNNNSFGWNLGGGLIINVAPHIGVRGDIRHFHSFQDVGFAGFTLSGAKLDFGRASAGIVLSF